MTPSFAVLLGICLFSAGCLISGTVYASIEPAAVGMGSLVCGLLLIASTPLGGHFERRMFLMVFSTGWFWASIAAVYAVWFGDIGQTKLDAANFYNISSGDRIDYSMRELMVHYEGAVMIVVWHKFYSSLSALGFEKGRYIGIAVNVLIVALTGVVAVKIARRLHGEDRRKIHRLILLFSSCGLFWLFASIHLRDAAVLLSVTTLSYFWVRYLSDGSAPNLALLIAATLAGFALFGFLRAEFIYVPIAMIMAGLGSFLIFSGKKGVERLIVYAILVVMSVALVCFFVAFGAEFLSALSRGMEFYTEHERAFGATDSLGNRFITNAPLPIRLVLGSASLFIFPIPFWAGFQPESAYDLFKSINVLFFYAFTPLFLLSLRRFWKDKASRNAPMAFLLFLTSGFTLATAATSVETRHFGVFLAPMMVFATLPDFAGHEKGVYRRSLLFFLFLIAMVHLAWATLKFI